MIMRRFVAALCCMVMVFGRLMAWTGSGTEQNPYQLSSLSDLETLATEVAADNNFSGKYFILTADIDTLTRTIGRGRDYPFCGNLDGCGHTVTVNISGTGNYIGGLFAALGSEDGGAYVHDLVVNGTVDNSYYSYAGGIASFAEGTESSPTLIENCLNKAAVSAAICSGGIVGYVYQNVTIRNCYTSGSSYANNCTANGGAGGVVGHLGTNCILQNVVNAGTILNNANR